MAAEGSFPPDFPYSCPYGVAALTMGWVPLLSARVSWFDIGRLLTFAGTFCSIGKIAAWMNGLPGRRNRKSVNRMSSKKTKGAKLAKGNETVLIVLLIYWLFFAWILAFSESVRLLDWNGHVINYTDKLVVLIIASMTAATTLLITTPEDNGTKQISFLLIAVTGVVAATVAIPPLSWGLFICLVAGLVPVVSALFLVFWRLFEGSRWAYLLLVWERSWFGQQPFCCNRTWGCPSQSKLDIRPSMLSFSVGHSKGWIDPCGVDLLPVQQTPNQGLYKWVGRVNLVRGFQCSPASYEIRARPSFPGGCVSIVRL